MSTNGRAIPFSDPQTFLQNVLESSTEYSIVAADPQGKILLWNEGAHRIYGYTPEQIIGQDTRLLHPPEDVRSGKVDQYLTAAATHGKWEGVLRPRRKNGEEFPARVVCTVLRDEVGTQLGFLLVTKDITAEERLHQKLIESEEYARGLFEANVDAAMTTDTRGVITDVNKRVEELSGRPRAKLIGTPLRDYFTDPVRADEGIRRVLAENKVTNFELTLRSARGEELVAALNATTFRARDGTLRGVFAAARDVTEQKALETQLREAQNYTRSLIEASLDALVTVDQSGVITDLNRQMESASGYSREELIGSEFKTYFTDPRSAVEGVQRTFRQGLVRNYELVLKPRAGPLRIVSLNASVYRDPDGAVQGLFASARDVTEQRTLEEQLRETQNYNRGLIEASVDAMVIVDPDLRVTDVNEQMVKLTGHTRQQLVGSAFTQYFTEPKGVRAGVRRILEKGFVTNYELVLRSKNGRETSVSVNASVFKDTEGRVKGIFASVRDITEQLKLDAQLRESRNYNRRLIESSIDGLMMTDLSGVITDVNKEMESLTGLPRQELMGTPFRHYFTDPDRAEEAIRRVLSESKVTDYELTIRTPLGLQTDVSYNATTFQDTEGRLQGVIAAARDITEQKRLRDQLELRNRELEIQNRRVQEANQLKSMFLANMSHELRTPLNSIIGFSDFLLAKDSTATTAEQREYLRDILNSGNHLLQLINDVLDLAKVESGKMELAIESFSPRKAVEEVCSVVKGMVAEKHIVLRTDIAIEIDTVQLDSLRFKQILYNLLSNAVKFTEEGGRVSVSIRPYTETLFALRVEDNGIGIAPDNIPRLFREFEQLDSGPGRRYPGSGLGLSLTKKLVELHGGSIDLISEVGKGTTFTILLPYSLDPAAGDRSTRPTATG